ncbi:RNA recognition motif domain-containing protein [Ditylenchus destructor]|nr:RNA recognition motif domain-containing protein [Ditylenchus destructor]
MLAVRAILQGCARNASILGGIPRQIQCASNFNPIYSESTYISRLAYSSDANEASNNDSVQKYILEMMNPKKSPTNLAECPKTSKTPTFNKNLNFRKYYISVNGLSKETTPESLREFYSQFGEIAYCTIVFPGEPNQFGSVAFTSEEAFYRALDSVPHCIDGKHIERVRPASLGKKQLTLQVLNLAPETTPESLQTFYSRFGSLTDCWIKQGTTAKVGQLAHVTFAYQKDMHRALDAQPHVIDGSEVFLKYATFDLDLRISDIPEFITDEELITFYSKYGQLRECRVLKGRTGLSHAFVSYSAISEVNRAMADRPHIIGGKPMKISFLGLAHNSDLFSLFVGSLPENATEESLREEFSKFGKPVFWKLENDGGFNQSRVYGIVSYGTEEEAIKALNSGPHTIEGTIVDVRKAAEMATLSKGKTDKRRRRGY